jgi:GTP cyclohydrolase IA
MFREDYKEMVIVKTLKCIPCANTICFRFLGKRTWPIFPTNILSGISKIPRVVDAFARRLQVQERLTREIKDSFMRTLKPLGVAVVIEASICA